MTLWEAQILEKFQTVRFNIPSLEIRKLNLFSSKGLVNRSANWNSVFTKYNSMVPHFTWSLIKWYRISMCLVLECWTGSQEIAMALSSHSRSGFYCSENQSLLVESASIVLAKEIYNRFERTKEKIKPPQEWW